MLLRGPNTRGWLPEEAYVVPPPVLRKLPCLFSYGGVENEAIHRCGRAGKNAMALKEMDSNGEPTTGGKPIRIVELPPRANLLAIASPARITSLCDITMLCGISRPAGLLCEITMPMPKHHAMRNGHAMRPAKPSVPLWRVGAVVSDEMCVGWRRTHGNYCPAYNSRCETCRRCLKGLGRYIDWKPFLFLLALVTLSLSSLAQTRRSHLPLPLPIFSHTHTHTHRVGDIDCAFQNIAATIPEKTKSGRSNTETDEPSKLLLTSPCRVWYINNFTTRNRFACAF